MSATTVPILAGSANEGRRRYRLRPYAARNPVVWTALACLLVGLTACRPAPRTAAPPPPVRIGLLAPLSGPIADNVGRPALHAAELAVAEVNRRGGLRVGDRLHAVELVVADSGSDPHHAMDVVRQWLGHQELTAFVGPMLSTTAVPVAAVAESNGLLMITPSASSPLVIADKRWVFRTTFNDLVQGWALGRFAREELGDRGAVLFDEATDYGRGLATEFRKSFEHHGGQVVAFEGYVTGDEDFRPQLERIRSLDSEMLLLPNYVRDLGAQLAQIEELAIDITVLGTDSWAPNAFAGEAKAEGAIHVVSWHVEAATAADQPFIEAFRQLAGEDPAGPAALSYDSLGMLFAAIESAGLDAEALRARLAATEDYSGLTGAISYHGRNGAAKPVYLVRNENGAARVIHQIDTHELGLDESEIHR